MTIQKNNNMIPISKSNGISVYDNYYNKNINFKSIYSHNVNIDIKKSSYKKASDEVSDKVREIFGIKE